MPDWRSRRGAGAGLLLMVLSLSAWAGEHMLRVANPGKPASLDPHRITGVWENRIVGDMFMGLTTEAADGSVAPGAAESWAVSMDGRVYEFVLRDHEWSDGRPVTAADFVYSFRRMLAPETACAYADFFFVIEGAQAFTAGEGDAAAVGVEALDERRLRIRLTRPVAYFPGLLMHFAAMPVPPHVVDRYAGDWTDQQYIVVNGPYRLAARVPNDHVELHRNPGFYAADEVAVEAVRYYSQENRAAAVQRYRAGELDVLRDFPSGQAADLRKRFGDAVRTEPYLGLTYVAVNHQRPALARPEVRAALSMALDRDILTGRVLGSGEQPAWSLVPPGADNYGEPALLAYADWPAERRLEQARAAMARAGYGPDAPLQLALRLRTSENERRIAVAAQSMWRQIWVDAELIRAETAVHYAQLQSGNYDLALASWLAVYSDPQTFTLLLQSETGPNNLGRFADEEYDLLTARAARETDLLRRASLLRQAEARALELHGLIPVFHHAARNLVAPAVRGWIPNSLDVHRTRYLSLAR